MPADHCNDTSIRSILEEKKTLERAQERLNIDIQVCRTQLEELMRTLPEGVSVDTLDETINAELVSLRNDLETYTVPAEVRDELARLV